MSRMVQYGALDFQGNTKYAGPKTYTCQKFPLKYRNMKFHDNLSGGCGVFLFHTEGHNAFRNCSANASKKTQMASRWICCLHLFDEDNSTWLTLVQTARGCGYCYNSNKTASRRVGGGGGGEGMGWKPQPDITVLRQPSTLQRTDSVWVHATNFTVQGSFRPTVAKIRCISSQWKRPKISATESLRNPTRYFALTSNKRLSDPSCCSWLQ
jgi:hypothetical protein